MLVHIENLVKRYGDLLALDHLSLDIEEGEIFGLLGPNGSGKTTAINCLLALLKYDKGTITIFGKDMKPDSYDIKQDIGVVMQNVAVFEQMSVYENIDYFCGLYIKDKQKRKELVEEAIAFTGLSDFRKMRPKKLSGGLHDLVEKIKAMGMRFGIWFEPEMISEDSDLYRAHPDWILQTPERNSCHGRNQYVLDFSRKEVVDCIYDMMYKILSESKISYIKWDMNRSIPCHDDNII